MGNILLKSWMSREIEIAAREKVRKKAAVPLWTSF